MFAAEASFFAVVPPLVPRLVHEVHLTTTGVGILVAAYPAGVLLATIPSMALVDRRGVRTTTIAGLAILVVATLGFGWGTTPVMLDGARLVQGMGGAVAWAGALAWLTSTTPTGRRGAAIGGAIGSALIGMVLGPAMGALASWMGRAVVFSSLTLVLAVLALAAPATGGCRRPGFPGATASRGDSPLRKGPAPASTRRSATAVPRLLRNRSAAIGSGVLFVVGIVGGTLASLVPLLVAHRQGGAGTIAGILATFYLLGALLNVVFGHLSDRFGRLMPTLAALAVAAVLLPLLPAFHGLPVLAIATVGAGAVVAGLWTPTAAMITDGAAPGPAGHAVGVATMNAAWAAGSAGGAVAVARLADTAGFSLPFALVGGLCAAAAVTVFVCYRRR